MSAFKVLILASVITLFTACVKLDRIDTKQASNAASSEPVTALAMPLPATAAGQPEIKTKSNNAVASVPKLKTNIATAQPAQLDKSSNNVVSVLQAAKPTVNWVAATAKNADFTCDGKADTAIVGYEKPDVVWLGLVPSSNTNTTSIPLFLKFFKGKQAQDSFCSVPITLKAVSLKCTDEDIGKLPGCKPVKECFEIVLSDDSCDSIHVYWNNNKRNISWWRR